MIYPDNLIEVLDNDKFHHTEKGCDMELRPHKANDGNWSQEYFCKTHNVLCSKTGWELGFYQGTKSEYKPTLIISYCQTCGAKIESKSSRMFCDKCKYERMVARANRVALENREKAIANKKKRDEERAIIKEHKKLMIKGLKKRKLDDLLGFISEYKKADYSERIRDYEYNELVKKADEIIVKFLNKNNKTYNNFNL